MQLATEKKILQLMIKTEQSSRRRDAEKKKLEPELERLEEEDGGKKSV